MSLGARLNKRITLQISTPVRNEAGDMIDVWSNVVTAGDGKVWAEVRDATGREFNAAGATQNQVLTTITIRHRADVVPKMRVLCGADIYGIEAVLGQDQRTLALMCSRMSA